MRPLGRSCQLTFNGSWEDILWLYSRITETYNFPLKIKLPLRLCACLCLHSIPKRYEPIYVPYSFKNTFLCIRKQIGGQIILME